ncbi:hypothetical protein D3C81_2178480 [compost metagenome]
MLANPLLRQVLDRLTINCNAALLRIIETEQQIDNRAFTRAGMTYESDGLTLLRFKGNVLQHVIAFVSEGYVFELNVPFIARH